MKENNESVSVREVKLSEMTASQMKVFADNKNSMLMELYNAYIKEKYCKK